VRPRLTNRESPFPLITMVPCEVGFKGFDSHDMPLALALRIDVGAWLIHFLDSLPDMAHTLPGGPKGSLDVIALRS
jgi:hypothetical protein